MNPYTRPEGWYTQTIRAGFPPRFVSQIEVNPRTKRMLTEYQLLNRPTVGFDAVALGLPGAVHYERGAPSMVKA